ncbi:MAG: hypothetical protein JNK56_17845 [Myxococcales bacterium]|nr:hypothetical protein [Myxococcales bacterium]
MLRELRPQTRAWVDLEVPTDHNAGLFWYHPQRHGAAMVQFLSGMSGAVIGEGVAFWGGVEQTTNRLGGETVKAKARVRNEARSGPGARQRSILRERIHLFTATHI